MQKSSISLKIGKAAIIAMGIINLLAIAIILFIVSLVIINQSYRESIGDVVLQHVYKWYFDNYVIVTGF